MKGLLILAHIYKIINDINDKVYIGKTYGSVEKRWREHLRDCRKRRCEKRPLYAAMRKYGIEHFYVREIEETDCPEMREVFWIEQYDSYANGYNATLGGDGKSYLDYDLIVEKYLILYNQKEVANVLHIDEHTVKKVLIERGVEIRSNVAGSKRIAQYDLSGNFIESFFSSADASRKLISDGLTGTKNVKSVSRCIRNCANGEYAFSYGFVWKFI